VTTDERGELVNVLDALKALVMVAYRLPPGDVKTELQVDLKMTMNTVEAMLSKPSRPDSESPP
jgi:hypothetical protein